MNLKPDTLDRFAIVLCGCIAFGSGATIPAGVENVSAVSLSGVFRRLADRGGGPAPVVARLKAALAAHWRDWAEVDDGDLAHAAACFDTVADACAPPPARIVALNLRPDAIADAVLAAAVARRPDLFGDTAPDSAAPRIFLRNLARAAAEHMLADEAAFRRMAPEIFAQLLEDGERTRREMAAMEARLMAAIAAGGATPEGLTQEAVIALARRVAADTADFEQARRELENAVEIAAQVIAEGARGSNLGAFVDDVLRRLADYTREGRYDEGSAYAGDVFAEWERAEAERREAAKAEGLRLLDAGLEQALLARDADTAAARIARKLALEADAPAPSFAALQAACKDWLDRGRDRGLNADLEVAIALARRLDACAADADQRGAALVWRGNALAILGAREPEPARLEQAVAAYRAALEERTRDRIPLGWAGTTGNQGAAPTRLAARTGDAAMAARAVAQLEAARDVMAEGGHAPHAAFYEAKLPAAIALRDRLACVG